MLIALLIETQG